MSTLPDDMPVDDLEDEAAPDDPTATAGLAPVPAPVVRPSEAEADEADVLEQALPVVGDEDYPREEAP